MYLWHVLFMYLFRKKYLVAPRHHIENKGDLTREGYFTLYQWPSSLWETKGDINSRDKIWQYLLDPPSFYLKRIFPEGSTCRRISSSFSAGMRGYQQYKNTSPPPLPHTQMHQIIIIKSMISDTQETPPWVICMFFFLTRGYCVIL